MKGLFTKEQEQLVERVDALVFSSISKRAAELDAKCEFPDADFRDLHREGLLLATLPKKDGGLGYGFDGEDPLSFFLIIERLAAGNPSTAHCFQVHSNAAQIVRAFGSDEQVERFLEPTRTAGRLLVGAGSEPGGGRGGTTAKPVTGGLSVTGVKHYATNASRSAWMTVHVRNEETGLLETVVVPKEAEGLEIDEVFWNPAGMRACVSPLLKFNNCFVPDDCVLGRPGAFFTENWLGKINFGFTANYLGTIQAMYQWVVDYMRQRGQVDTQVYQMYLGELRAKIDAARLLYYHAVKLAQVDIVQGLLKSNEAKYLAVDCLQRFKEVAGQLVGSTAFFRTFPLERMMRDMDVHSLHRRHHFGAVMVGQAELGLPYELAHS
ncbi:acyl-CoA dehydrogenase family protein [Hydrogenophaga sp. OTU3427]|uniref:acyl-CoA dehydrogenase family protein n=1 Tax=Hydrogenophaga sp. OTU3427 TaxID=3043856 RepID=UPI00313E8BD7